MPQGPVLLPALPQQPSGQLSQKPLRETNPVLSDLKDFLLSALGVSDGLGPDASNAAILGVGAGALFPLLGSIRKAKTAEQAISEASAAVTARQQGIKAYHGSPHDFNAERLIKWPDGRTEYLVGGPSRLPDVPQGASVVQEFPLGRMRMDKMGTGEGAQAYGPGLYTAEAERVAEQYKRDLSKVVKSFSGRPTQTAAEEMAHDILTRIPRGSDENATLERALRTVDEWAEMGVFKGKNESNAVLDVKRAIGDNFGKKLDTALQGKTYEVSLNASPDDFLDWDKPLSQQSEKVQALMRREYPEHFEQMKQASDLETKIKALSDKYGKPGDSYKAAIERAPESVQKEWKGLVAEHSSLSHISPGATLPTRGEEIYRQLRELPEDSAARLKAAGIKGIRYLDQGSRDAKGWVVSNIRKSDNVTVGEKVFKTADEANAYSAEMKSKGMDTKIRNESTSNYVVFDDAIIDIMKKYGVALPIAAAGLKAQQERSQRGQAHAAF